MKNKILGFIFVNLLTMCALAEEAPVQDPGLTLIDSATIPCTKNIAEKKQCEVYLAYDIRDDIVYLVKRRDRKTDRSIQNLLRDREALARQSIKVIDLVKEFSAKVSPVKSYSAGFKKVDRVMKIRISLQFEEDQNAKKDPQEQDIQTEKLLDVDFYKNENI